MYSNHWLACVPAAALLLTTAAALPSELIHKKCSPKNACNRIALQHTSDCSSYLPTTTVKGCPLVSTETQTVTVVETAPIIDYTATSTVATTIFDNVFSTAVEKRGKRAVTMTASATKVETEYNCPKYLPSKKSSTYLSPTQSVTSSKAKTATGLPSYAASACPGGASQYVSACSCNGIKGAVTTKAGSTITSTLTLTLTGPSTVVYDTTEVAIVSTTQTISATSTIGPSESSSTAATSTSSFLLGGEAPIPTGEAPVPTGTLGNSSVAATATSSFLLGGEAPVPTETLGNSSIAATATSSFLLGGEAPVPTETLGNSFIAATATSSFLLGGAAPVPTGTSGNSSTNATSTSFVAPAPSTSGPSVSSSTTSAASTTTTSASSTPTSATPRATPTSFYLRVHAPGQDVNGANLATRGYIQPFDYTNNSANDAGRFRFDQANRLAAIGSDLVASVRYDDLGEDSELSDPRQVFTAIPGYTEVNRDGYRYEAPTCSIGDRAPNGQFENCNYP